MASLKLPPASHAWKWSGPGACRHRDLSWPPNVLRGGSRLPGPAKPEQKKTQEAKAIPQPLSPASPRKFFVRFRDPAPHDVVSGKEAPKLRIQ